MRGISVWQCRVGAALDWRPSCVEQAGAVDLGVNRAACWLGGGLLCVDIHRLPGQGEMTGVEEDAVLEMRTRHCQAGRRGLRMHLRATLAQRQWPTGRCRLTLC
jgi:hypothetical protein